MVMKLIVPRETQVSHLTHRLKRGGLGVIARDGEYTLVVRKEHPSIFTDEQPFDLWDQPVDTMDTQDLSP